MNDPTRISTTGTIPTGKAAGRSDENVVDLISRLTSQSAHLAQEQVALFQAEMRESVTELKVAVGAMAGAAVLGVAGLGVTLMGIAYLIGDAIGDRDLATLLVGIATLIIAGIMYASARSKLSANELKPDRTIATAERTPDAATGNIHHSGEIR